MKKLHINIQKSGETQMKVEGAVGNECETFTKAFEEVVGELTSREYTEDYYREDVVVDQDVQERL